MVCVVAFLFLTHWISPLPGCGKQKCLQIFSNVIWGAKLLPDENHWDRGKRLPYNKDKVKKNVKRRGGKIPNTVTAKGIEKKE